VEIVCDVCVTVVASGAAALGIGVKGQQKRKNGFSTYSSLYNIQKNNRKFNK
jgi:hypothetical protein